MPNAVQDGGAASPPSAEDPVPAEVRKAQQLLEQGAPGDAERLLLALLRHAPKDIEAHYALAVAHRHQHKWTLALQTLKGVLELKPGFGRAWQEVGYNHIAMRQFAHATASFEEATSADPSLINSWKCLAKLYQEHASADSAETARKLALAQEQVESLSALPAELLAVSSYLAEGQLKDAERLCKHFLRGNKTHVEGMRLLAEIATRNRVFDEAEFLLDSCVAFEPQHKNARIQYANILLRVQKFASAYEQTSRLLREHPDDGGVVRSLHAAACNGVGKSAEAIEHYRQLMRSHPGNHLYPVSLAHVYKADGDIDAAVALYQEAYRRKPDHGDAYWSLANTKSYVFTSGEVERMKAVEAEPATGEEDRLQICFALGNALETAGDYEAAFKRFSKGNALKQARAQHSAEQLQVRVDSQMQVCTRELFERRAGLGCEAADPIFIVGLPRAGSTLLEQILASHSQVDGTMELHNVLNLAKRLRGRDERPGQPRYPRILGELEDSYFRRFGEQFIDDTRPYRGDAPFFIDKMPNNFFHVGLIKLILPNAKVVDARRHPLACCFSGFKQLFGEGQEFTYGLREVGNYYRQYVKLMDHWDDVLPGFVLRVQHEDVVDDLEGQVRRLLDFCALPFEPACVEFHRTERSVRTPSSEQVRQPIYRSGLQQWRNFEPWLDPLKEALGPEVREHYGIH